MAEARAQVAGAVAAAQARGGPTAVKVGSVAGVEQAWATEEATVRHSVIRLHFIRDHASEESAFGHRGCPCSRPALLIDCSVVITTANEHAG